MARVTVEDCVERVPNRFELVMLAAKRSREISSGSVLTVERDNDKNPVCALREIADETVPLDDLREELVRGLQKHVEVDEPEEDDEGNTRPPLVFDDIKHFSGIYLELNSQKSLNRNYTQFFKIKLVKNVNSGNNTLFNINNNKYLSRITKQDENSNGNVNKALFKYKYTNRSVDKYIDWDDYFKDRKTKWNTYIITNEKKNAYNNKIVI